MMNAFQQTIDSERLAAVLALPPAFRHRSVQITVQPVDEAAPRTTVSRARLREMLPGSITESLIGAVPSALSLADIREERLRKYQ